MTLEAPERPAEQPAAERPWPRVSRLRVALPVVLIVAALVAAGISATMHESRTTSTTSGTAATHAAAPTSVPITYAAAAKAGKTGSYDWGPRCDHRTGRIEMPTNYAAPCVPVFTGDNGGSIGSGVSGDTVNLVYYQPEPGGLAAAVQGAAGTPATTLATIEDYVAMFNHIFELYGRHVRLIVFNATGADTDPVAAHADAVTVAQQLHAFASLGGPLETPAYQDELARLHVLCMGCGDSALYGEITLNAPYQWANLPAADTSLKTVVDYLIHQLNGKDAIWAGDPAMHTQKRRFVVVNETSEPPQPGYSTLTAEVTNQLRDARANMALDTGLQYTLSLSSLPTQAATLAEKLKSIDATTVVFAGDPIMPIYLTRDCAKEGYFPEWVITGTALTDTSTLGRYYEESEWSHAFGVTSLAVPAPIATGDAYHLYRWWYGANTTPPATTVAPAILPAILQFFSGLQLAGPHLTAQAFAAGLFRAPPAGGSATTPLQAYGYQGAPPLPSYSSPADYTFIWYNADAKGPDEEGTNGAGLMEYVDGGKRYKVGVVPDAPVDMFSSQGAVTSYTSPPDRAPSYPPWPGSPAAAG